ncbi:hypothetical protein SBRCBS47491_008844 [Sporothrix bragantina]|uniref:DUF8004 domain-containing protein n=1 Tax=Sporothrix bragantina TaxID=671064 RepID=A0ABP0CPW8_9PEZI
MAHAHESRDFALYNGVSNRSRGWKSRQATESPAPAPQTHRHTSIRRWDGKTKSTTIWDGLRRDPELWFRHGNCFVHLYARGQSRRGPAFKLPISTLLAAQCHSLVERFITRDIPNVPDAGFMHDTMMQPMPMPPPLAALDYWSRAHLIGRVDLYITPPPNADRDQTFLYYLAIRNLFAWVFRRPVVGEFLGSTLASLYSAMREFRHPQADNVQDLLCYLDDEDYSAMAGHPAYALALLHLGETMRYRALYIDAFSHCVGMYNDLHLGSEYQYISSASRKLVRRARLDMDMRLGSAGSMLSNLLEEQLSEAHLGLPEPARAHLERFRTYVQGFYASRLGYYPPASMDSRSTIFEPHVYRILSDDFKALYEFLVDESFTADVMGPTLAQGGFCVLQSVKAFDERHGFTSLEHPLPLLPEPTPQQAAGTATTTTTTNVISKPPNSSSSSSAKRSGMSRRMSWLGGKKLEKLDKLLLSRTEKLKPDTRLVANAALLKASNKVRTDLWRNEFVAAYRQFEEDSVFKPYKADRIEKISMIDARKVRWILVYAVHQTLQHCFLPPPAEVNGAGAVNYHMSISPKHLPTWEDGCASPQQSSPISPISPASPASPTTTAWTTEPFTMQAFEDNSRNSYYSDAAPPVRCMSMTAVPDAPTLRSLAEAVDGRGTERGRALSPVFDIRPDIDYLGLANRGSDSTAPLEGEVVMLPRSRSLTRSLSQKANFRRSLSLFRGNQNNNTATFPSDSSPKPTKLQKGKHIEGIGHRASDPLPAMPALPATIPNPTTTSKRNSFLQRSFSQSTSEQAKSKLQRAASTSRERQSSPYHEIVVHGYGNGTNPVQLAVSTDPAALSAEATDDKPTNDSVATPSTSRSLSTSSTNSNTSALTTDTAVTALTALTELTDIKNMHHTSIGCAVTVITPNTTVTADDVAFPEVPTMTRTLSRSSSVYSNASAKATTHRPPPVPSLAMAQVPAIPPRGRGRQILQPPSTSSMSRSSSVYSLASMADSPYHVPGVGVAVTTAAAIQSCVTSASAAPAAVPPVPVRSSARHRHRRFSVYGGGDEFAASAMVLPLATPQKRTMSMVPDPARKMPLRSRTQPSLSTTTERLDMMQEALLAVRETMDQQMGHSSLTSSSSGPISRTSSFVGVAALRSVYEEEDELTMSGATAARRDWTQPAKASLSSRQRHRHSSYIGPRDNDYDDDDNNVPVIDDVQPEWEKFAMGLGGHTVV